MSAKHTKPGPYGKTPLVITKDVMQDIVQQQYRMFLPYTENFTIQLTPTHIQILVFPAKGAPFILPDGSINLTLDRTTKVPWLND